MSGHSKWHKIQHKKGKNDKARSSMFTKLLRAVTVAAMQGGGDIDMNFSLRLAVQKAKAENVPKDNIDRAIKKGIGELHDGTVIEEIVYEGFGPGGVAMMVEAMTDNKNRTASEVKFAFSKHNGSLGGPGSVQWQFDHKGVVRISEEQQQKISDWENVQLELMDAGAEDIISDEGIIEIQTSIEQLQSVLSLCDSHNLELEDSGLEWVAKDAIDVDDDVIEKNMNLYEALDELDDVKQVYTNI